MVSRKVAGLTAAVAMVAGSFVVAGTVGESAGGSTVPPCRRRRVRTLRRRCTGKQRHSTRNVPEGHHTYRWRRRNKRNRHLLHRLLPREGPDLARPWHQHRGVHAEHHSFRALPLTATAAVVAGGPGTASRSARLVAVARYGR